MHSVGRIRPRSPASAAPRPLSSRTPPYALTSGKERGQLKPAGTKGGRSPESQNGRCLRRHAEVSARSLSIDPLQQTKRIQPTRGGREMTRTSRSSDANSPIPSRSAPPLLRALLLGGSLLFAACGTGALASGAPAASAAPSASAPASPAIAGALQNDFINVVGRVNPSVVVIETKTGLGSGVVFDANGDIVTNNHVVAG